MARDYDYDRKRNTWERGRDEVRSWFGDEEAERRRLYDARNDDREGPGAGYANPYRERGSRGGMGDMEFDRDWDMDDRSNDRFEGYRSGNRPGAMPRGGWHERDEHSMYGGSQAGRWGGREGMPPGSRTSGSPDYSGRGPSGYRRSDERIAEEINDSLTWDRRVDATDITVEVADGIATLSGTVSDRRMKRRAEDLADDIRGIEDVHNQLRVQRSTGSGSGESQAGGQTARQSGGDSATGYDPDSRDEYE